jgi:hypothetical protein
VDHLACCAAASAIKSGGEDLEGWVFDIATAKDQEINKNKRKKEGIT